ncbi:CdaR family protein [Clostridium sp. 'White wine YQ']|uniref:CdaR family protein n=1 Tax=Clostridium sp. 'White wine YQ' TaxID=3027474 RepID=UPI002365589D|nr:CdaR family protein [Clostridium sp. 'White wine YQ']MDD7795949.1 CdaR family protein [Clostridium sp. 'White wine YQ']
MDQKVSKKQQIIIQIICVILSFGLWLYISNVESPVRTYTLEKVPVEILNEGTLKNSGLVLEPNQKVYVDLKLEGPSSEVYSVKKEQFKITADLESYALKKGQNNVPVEIVDYPSNINIKNDGFLRVTIVIDQLETKTISVKNELNISTRKEYYAGEPTLSVNKGTISGPSKYVNSVASLVAKGDFLNLDKDFSTSVKLVPVDSSNNKVENINIEPANIDVTIPVRQLKPIKVNVITTGNLPSGLSLKSILSEDEYIELQGNARVIDNIASIDTEAIDLSKITSSGSVKVNLKFPDGVTSQTKEVNVDIQLEKIISKDILVPVTVKSLGDGLASSLNKTQVKVTISGLESNVNKYTPDMFKGEIDLSNLAEGTYDLTPKITAGNSNNITISPQEKVTVVITKK